VTPPHTIPVIYIEILLFRNRYFGIEIKKFGIGIDKFEVELELTKWN